MLNIRQKTIFFQLFYFLLGPLLCFIIQGLPVQENMAPNGMLCLGACVWLLIWWVTEIFPIPIVALMSVLIFSFLGIMPAAKVFAALSSPACMLVFGATIIVGLLKESRFVERYAYWSFNLPFIQGSSPRLLFVFAMSAGIMSSIVPNIPMAILFTSIAVIIGKSSSLNSKNSLMRSMMVLCAVAPSVGGAGTPLGGAVNIVVIGLITSTVAHEITFWEWTMMGFPLILITLTAMFLLCLIIFPMRGDNAKLPIRQELLKQKIDELGSVSRYEHIAVGVLVFALILWSFGPQIAGIIGWEAGKKMLNASFVAILVGVATFMIPLRQDKETGKITYAMDMPKAVKHIAWSIMLINMGTLSFGSVLLQGGIDKWAAGLIQILLGDISGVWVWLMLVILTGLASQIVSNLALVALMLPITAVLAGIYDFHLLAACLSVGFASNVAVMFPFSSLTGAAVMISGGDLVNPRDFIWFGFWTTIVVSIITFLFCLFIGPLVLPVI